jgi:hypothetical protein
MRKKSIALNPPLERRSFYALAPSIHYLSREVIDGAAADQGRDFLALRRSLKSDAALTCDARLFKRVQLVVSQRELVRLLPVAHGRRQGPDDHNRRRCLGGIAAAAPGRQTGRRKSPL